MQRLEQHLAATRGLRDQQHATIWREESLGGVTRFGRKGPRPGFLIQIPEGDVIAESRRENVLIRREVQRFDWRVETEAGVIRIAEAAILKAVEASISGRSIARCRSTVFGLRGGGPMTVLEWLKTPPKRHSPSALAERLMRAECRSRSGVIPSK